MRLVLELGLAGASCRSVGFDKTTDPSSLPDVDVYAEKGSGIPTIVGARLDNLTSGQVVTPATTLLTRDGDSNQEYITNNAVLAWRTMRCSHFSLTDNPGVDHFALPRLPVTPMCSTDYWST